MINHPKSSLQPSMTKFLCFVPFFFPTSLLNSNFLCPYNLHGLVPEALSLQGQSFSWKPLPRKQFLFVWRHPAGECERGPWRLCMCSILSNKKWTWLDLSWPDLTQALWLKCSSQCPCSCKKAHLYLRARFPTMPLGQHRGCHGVSWSPFCGLQVKRNRCWQEPTLLTRPSAQSTLYLK